MSFYPNYSKGLTGKLVISFLLLWFMVYIAVRTKFVSGVISSAVPINLFVAASIVAIAASIHRVSVERKFFVLFMTSLLYSFFLVGVERLPLQNILQFFLSTKFVFIFLATSLVASDRRQRYWLGMSRVILFLLFLSLPFAALDFVAPGTIFEIAADERGFGGVSVGSFFASRVLYSEFLLLVLILLICIPEGSDGLYFSSSRAFRPYTLALVVVMLILTFSRKEILIGAVILIAHYGNFSRIKPAWAAKSAMAIMFLFAFVVFFIAFMDLMLQNFSEGYVRFKIFMAAWDIFSSHFPLGSGPGTFGTAMSKSYTDVYLEFQVPTAVTGTSGEFDGPIFDLFFISFFAEYGLGAFLIFWLFIYPFRTTPTETLAKVVDVRRFRIYLALVVFGAGFFVPIMGNVVGLLAFFALGLLTQHQSMAPDKA